MNFCWNLIHTRQITNKNLYSICRVHEYSIVQTLRKKDRLLACVDDFILSNFTIAKSLKKNFLKYFDYLKTATSLQI